MPSSRSRAGPRPADTADLGELVGRVAMAWIRWAKEEARRRDLSSPQLVFVRGLDAFGPKAVTRWAESMGASPSATTALLDGLETAGFIVRSHDPKDRRQIVVTLTPKGRRLARQVRTSLKARWRKVAADLNPSQVAAASRLLQTVLDRIGEDFLPEMTAGRSDGRC